MTRNENVSWQYDEFRQVGTDYSSKAEVDIYESRHSDFRNLEAESIRILESLEIREGDTLIDIGSGTGVFALRAAMRCARVHAVDISRAMLDFAAAKARASGISNIEFHHGGFLTYAHKGPEVDAIVTTFAFHHLPDFWKGVALTRMHGMLKTGGRLYIHDVILEEKDALRNIGALIDRLAAAGGPALREDTERHFRDEYSTYDWVMDGLLDRAGFTIKSKRIEEGVLGTYICAR